jgi:hypothetical protein
MVNLSALGCASCPQFKSVWLACREIFHVVSFFCSLRILNCKKFSYEVRPPPPRKLLNHVWLLCVLSLLGCQKVVRDVVVFDPQSQLNEMAFFDTVGVTDPAILNVMESLKAQNRQHRMVKELMARQGMPQWKSVFYKVQAGAGATAKRTATATNTAPKPSKQGLFLIPFKQPDGVVSAYVAATQHNDSTFTFQLYNREVLNKIKSVGEKARLNHLVAQFGFGFFDSAINRSRVTTINQPNKINLKGVDFSWVKQKEVAPKGAVTKREAQPAKADNCVFSYEFVAGLSPNLGYISFLINTNCVAATMSIAQGDGGASNGQSSGNGTPPPSAWFYNPYWWNSNTGQTQPPETPPGPGSVSGSSIEPYTGPQTGNTLATELLYEISDEMRSHIEEIDREIEYMLDTTNSALSPCKGTNRVGNVKFNGVLEHWIVMIDYLLTGPPSRYVEYKIPGSSGYIPGNVGYADMVDELTGDIFEIKSNDRAQIDLGSRECSLYVAQANTACPRPIASLSWKKGGVYPTHLLPNPRNLLTVMEVKLADTGVVSYGPPRTNQLPIPLPVITPETVSKQLKRLLEKLHDNVSDPDLVILALLNTKDFMELRAYLKGGLYGVAFAIVVGTIVEDFLTAGAGLVDDSASFALAYRLFRLAQKL